jgi:simple sugar transport system substrate-binding protein
MANPLSPPAASPQAEVELQDLLRSFAAVLAEDDPVRRKIRLLREAERVGLSPDTYGGLLELSTRRKAPRWLLEDYTEWVVEWLRSLSLFTLLEYVGRMAILLAIVSFFIELPERRKEREYEAWSTVGEARGRRYSHARIDALERLNTGCVSLEGLDAAGSQLAGLRLDRCFGRPGGGLLGARFPRLFGRAGADLTGANLERADLTRARLPEAELSHARLSRARLAGAALGAATLAGADLRGADLFRADLRGASLRAADLSGANLCEADLRGADLTQARLPGARLTGADLRGAVLAYAGLGEANLARADLRGAELFHARLHGALLRKARLDGRTKLEGSEVLRADFRQAVLPSREQLRSARGLERALLDAPAPSPAGAARPFTLGVIVDDEQHFFREVLHGAREAAGRDARLVVRMASAGAGGKLENEAAIVREYLDRGVDAIVMVPQDERRSVPVVRAAFAAGVVVVCYDHCLDAADAERLVAANYESDQFALGQASGHALARWLRQRPGAARGAARVGILKYCAFEGCYRRVAGFHAALDEAGIAWTEAAYRNKRERESCAQAAAELLRAHPDVEVFWSANECGTESLVGAVRARGLAERVRVWGTDISPRLAGMLLAPDEVLQAVTGQTPREMGFRAVAAALAALRGRTAPFKTELVPHHLFLHGSEEARRYVREHPAARRSSR